MSGASSETLSVWTLTGIGPSFIFRGSSRTASAYAVRCAAWPDFSITTAWAAASRAIGTR